MEEFTAFSLMVVLNVFFFFSFPDRSHLGRWKACTEAIRQERSYHHKRSRRRHPQSGMRSSSDDIDSYIKYSI